MSDCGDGVDDGGGGDRDEIVLKSFLTNTFPRHYPWSDDVFGFGSINQIFVI